MLAAWMGPDDGIAAALLPSEPEAGALRALALALLPYLRELLALKQRGVELVNVAAMREALARPSRMRGRRAGGPRGEA